MKKYAVLSIRLDDKSVVVPDEGTRPIGNPDLLAKFPPNCRVGLFWYELADQFAFYIPTEQIRAIATGPVPTAVEPSVPETGLVARFEAAGYKNWHNPIDADVAAEPNKCACCGRKVAHDFKGFIKGNCRHAIAICTYCGNQFEF